MRGCAMEAGEKTLVFLGDPPLRGATAVLYEVREAADVTNCWGILARYYLEHSANY